MNFNVLIKIAHRWKHLSSCHIELSILSLATVCSVKSKKYGTCSGPTQIREPMKRRHLPFPLRCSMGTILRNGQDLGFLTRILTIWNFYVVFYTTLVPYEYGIIVLSRVHWKKHIQKIVYQDGSTVETLILIFVNMYY